MKKYWFYGLAILILVSGAGVFLFPKTENKPLASDAKADAIVVDKGARKLSLYHNGQLLKSYKIALGSHPQGHKHQEGDGKTPEGMYQIVWHNPKSAYHKSLRISYPNERDLAYAKTHGVAAGGDIMIHGFPNRAPASLFRFVHAIHDWTAGCIAVTNDEIDEIWNAVADGTSVLIRP
ncbi:MAG: L,D-transpeptidase family protein [Alphaproteobacteria bacterium]|nr:L,D-transpeptidase family protein [Alphaproteobacteria bacterium]